MRTSHECAPSCCKQSAFRLVCILATTAESGDRIPRRAENMQALLRRTRTYVRACPPSLHLKGKGLPNLCVEPCIESSRYGTPRCSCAWDGGCGRCLLLLPLFAHPELRRRYVSPAADELALPGRRVLPAHYYPLAVTPPSDPQNLLPPPAHVRNADFSCHL